MLLKNWKIIAIFIKKNCYFQAFFPRAQELQEINECPDISESSEEKQALKLKEMNR